ncbi:hypothetical protein B0A52_10322 [Exophiala mesophila]|uniref:Glucose-methanol-choline oxidoreductase N-terminal domain-containing protein n=1 Tax=Exophiala mesophila TaxID=212818 RepID=A0A438MRA2_EXOME|nr:hypothetical protein B0A52_10322 [Exophiala mesophila]
MKSTQYTFDFIVVGAGNAGAVTARNLADWYPKSTTLLIEAGGDNARNDLYVPSDRFTSPYKHPEIVKNYLTTPQEHLNGRVLDYLRGIGLGGSSIANFLAYIRGSKADYDRWATMVGDDSYKWKSIVEDFKAIENLHCDDQGDDEFVRPIKQLHGYRGPLDITLPTKRQWPVGMELVAEAARSYGYPINPDQNSGESIGVGTVSTTTYNGRRTTSATAYLTNVPSNLTIWTNSEVTRILLDNAGVNNGTSTPKVLGVRLRDGRVVTATKETILSLGSIDTPKLLLLSGIGPKDELTAMGIPCHVDLPGVGKEMIDHTYLVMAHHAKSDLSDVATFDADPAQVAAAHEQWMKDSTGPDAKRKTANLIGFLKVPPGHSSRREAAKLDPEVQAFLNHPNVPHYEVYWTGYSLEGVSHECFATALMMMNPQSRGTVTLASSDPKDDPIISPNYFSHPYDQKTMVDGLRESLRFLEQGDLSKYIVGPVLVPKSSSYEDILDFIKENLLTILHPVGTVKMGRHDDPKSCVDSHFRIKGVQGLRVVDLSVVPTITK